MHPSELLDALREKLQLRNGIDTSEQDVLVTAGANQAFVQAILCLCDAGDEAVVFEPFYFSHAAALQLCVGPLDRASCLAVPHISPRF